MVPDAHPSVTPTDVVYQMRSLTMQETTEEGNVIQVENWVKIGSGPILDVPDDGDCLIYCILRSMRAWSRAAPAQSGPLSVAKQRLDAFAQSYNLPLVDLDFDVPADPLRSGEAEKTSARHLRALMARHLHENFLRFYDASPEDREQFEQGYRNLVTWFERRERFILGEKMDVRMAKAERISRRLSILTQLKDLPTTSPFVKSGLERALEAANQEPPDHSCIKDCLDMLRERYDEAGGINRRSETRDAAVIMTKTEREWTYDTSVHVLADLLGVYVDYYQYQGNELAWTDSVHAGGYGPTLTDEERNALATQYAAHSVPPGYLPRFVVVKSPVHYRYQIPDDGSYLDNMAARKDVRLDASGNVRALDDDFVHMYHAALAQGERWRDDDDDFDDPCEKNRNAAAPVAIWDSVPEPVKNAKGEVLHPAYYRYWNYVTDADDKAAMIKIYEDYVQERNAHPLPGQIADWTRDTPSEAQNAVLDQIASMIWMRKYGASKQTQGSYTLAGGRVEGGGGSSSGADGGASRADPLFGLVGKEKRRDRFEHFLPDARRTRPFRFADHVMQKDEEPFTPEQLAYAKARLRKANEHFFMHVATRHGYGQIMLMVDTADRPPSIDRTQAQARHYIRKLNNQASEAVGRVDKSVHSEVLGAVKKYRAKRDGADRGTKEHTDAEYFIEGFNVAVRLLAGVPRFFNAPTPPGAWMFLFAFYRSTRTVASTADKHWTRLIANTSEISDTKHAQYKAMRYFERFMVFMNTVLQSQLFRARVEAAQEDVEDQFPKLEEL